MFMRRNPSTNISISFEGRKVPCKLGDTVAAAILAASPSYTRRTPKHGEMRAPYCMMGACFECLMEINGVTDQQACLTLVEDGMSIKRQILVVGSDWA